MINFDNKLNNNMKSSFKYLSVLLFDFIYSLKDMFYRHGEPEFHENNEGIQLCDDGLVKNLILLLSILILA